jgi:hypothetical protein
MKKYGTALIALAVLACLALPASADVTVDYEIGVDYENYRTYAWQPGTEAGQPQVQQCILYVVTHVFSEMNAYASGSYVYVQQWDVGVLSTGVVVDTKGYLVVDLIDSQSEKAVWSAKARKVMGLPDLTKLCKKVDKITRKMFKSFPPR